MINPLENAGVISVSVVITALRRRWWWPTGFVLICCTVVGIISSLSTPYYRATAIVEIQPEAPRVAEFEDVREVGASGPARGLEAFYLTQYQILSSRTVTNRSLSILEEDGVTDFLGKENAAAFFERHVSIDPIYSTELVEVNVEYPSLAMARQMADAIANAYRLYNLEKSQEATREAISWLRTEQGQYRDAKVASDKAVIELQTDRGLYSKDGAPPPTLSELISLQSSLAEVKAKRVRLEARVSEMTRVLKSSSWVDLARHLGTTDRVLEEQLLAYNRLVAKRESLSARYGPKYPALMTIQREIGSVSNILREGTKSVVDGLRSELQVVEAEEIRIGQAIDEMGLRVEALGDDFIKLELLRSEADRNEEFFRSLDRRISEVSLAQVLRANNVHVLDPARGSETPVRPNILLNLFSAGIVSLFLGSAMSVVLEIVNRTVHTGKDVEQHLGIPFAGFVPRISAAELRTVKDDTGSAVVAAALPRASITEAMRSLRTRISLVRRERPMQVILVTSTIPLEGKSFICLNLAAALAMGGSRTVLIDADLRRPTVHKGLGVPQSIGVAELLNRTVSFEEAIQPSHVPNLDYIPAGISRDRPAEMISEEKIRALVDELRDRYDYVMVDTSPVGVVSDGLTWAAQVDSVLFVTEYDRTRRAVSAIAARQTMAANPNILGGVINKVGRTPEEDGYNYYHYRYYSDSPEKSESA